MKLDSYLLQALQKPQAKQETRIADIAAGMYAYTNVLAALLQRGKTGKGSTIDVSMLESLGEWMSYPLYYAYEGATPPPRNGASHCRRLQRDAAPTSRRFLKASAVRLSDASGRGVRSMVKRRRSSSARRTSQAGWAFRISPTLAVLA